MSMFPQTVLDLAREVLARARAKGWKIAAAESCTGGLVAAALTEIPGSSDVIERGFVVYSNEAKTAMLGVARDLIAKHGAVSREVARAMAQGALARSPDDVSVAVTGIAGPGGGSAEKPPGLVYIATASRDGAAESRQYRFGDIGRSEIRMKSAEAALRQLLLLL